jgi:hypothetical protein
MIKHVEIFREEGRFAGWPANSGIWIWEDEILTGFELGYLNHDETWGHPFDRKKPVYKMQARSLDGGETWVQERPAPFNEQKISINDMNTLERKIDFQNPGFAMTFRMTSYEGASRAYFYYSYDKGKLWYGPFKMEVPGVEGIAARTDYLVYDKHECMAFMTAIKSNGKEGRPFCTKTIDGGKSWEFVSWIGPEPDGHAIMPSTVKLSDNGLLTAIRRLEGQNETATYWIETYISKDRGKTWSFLNKPVEKFGGNPPSMIKLQDGRICLTYGYRSKPDHGIRAKVSSDNGETWTNDIKLRTDGGGWDLGYPRTVQRRDGKIVTTYYYNLDMKKERFIGATIWDV